MHKSGIARLKATDSFIRGLSAELLRKVAQLEIVAAVDVVFVAVRIDAVDRQILRRSHHIRGGGVRCGNANQEQRQNDGQ